MCKLRVLNRIKETMLMKQVIQNWAYHIKVGINLLLIYLSTVELKVDEENVICYRCH